MNELKTYSGGCQCGQVRYEVSIDLDKPAVSCNCSMCGRAGTLLSFVPAAQFKLKSGDNVLTDYLFNTQHIHHLFCSVCGIKSFARGTDSGGKPTVAINARCLDEVDIDRLPVTKYDGKKA